MPFLPGDTSIGIDKVAAPVCKDTSAAEKFMPGDSAPNTGGDKKIVVSKAVSKSEENQSVPRNNFPIVAITFTSEKILALIQAELAF